jgi:hypothetical protein
VSSPWLVGDPKPFFPKEVRKAVQLLCQSSNKEDVESSSPLSPFLVQLNGMCRSASYPRLFVPFDRKVLIDGRKFNFAFGDITQKRAFVKTLTGQSDDLDVDVVRQSTVTRETFDSWKVTIEESNKSPESYQLLTQEGKPPLKLTRTELIVLMYRLGKALGLSKKEISRKLNFALKTH